MPIATPGDYGTAKYGVVGLSEILRLELAEAKVGVTVAARPDGDQHDCAHGYGPR